MLDAIIRALFPQYGKAIPRQPSAAEQRQEYLRNAERYQARADAAKAQREIINNPPPVHGSARWAEWKELREAGILVDRYKADHADPAGHGYCYIGPFLNLDESLRKRMDNWVYWDGEGHLLTVAPSRAGKSTLQIFQTLLLYNGSAVVFDPKGELYKGTSAWRAKHGRKVYRIAPFDDTATDGYNPLDFVQGHEDAQALAEMLYPRTATGDGTFFEDDAISFLTGIILHVVGNLPPEGCTLDTVREFCTLRRSGGDGPNFDDLVRELQASKVAAVRRLANVIEGDVKGNKTIQKSLQSVMALWDNPGLARCTAKSSFTFEQLKRERVTVYIEVPFHLVKPFSTFIRVMFSQGLAAMLREPAKPKPPVLFLVDEFLRLGPMPELVDALESHGSAGVRIWLFAQNVRGLHSLYGDDAERIFSETTVKSFIGIDDLVGASLISDYIGDTTVAFAAPTVSVSASEGQTTREDAGLGSQTSSGDAFGRAMQLIGRPLLTKREVIDFLAPKDDAGSRFGITFLRGHRPIRQVHMPYYHGGFYLERVGAADVAGAPCPVLQRLWNSVNEDVFGGALKPLAGLYWRNWPELGTKYGGMFHYHDADGWTISVSTAHKPDNLEDVLKVTSPVRAIMVHECLHQLQFQDLGHDENYKLGHDEVFYDFACAIAANAGYEPPEPNVASLQCWPLTPDVGTL